MTPLPIELQNFKAVVQEGKVTLNWVTASEINNHFFTAEHSFDGMLFEEFARIEGAGNSMLRLQYDTIHLLRGGA